MRKILSKFKTAFFGLACVALIITFICMCVKKESADASNENTVLSLWQIDNFEGGKGSRADFLQSAGNTFGKNEGCYINVVSLSADAARLNISKGNVPDIISYGAGMYGIENFVRDFTVWCSGSYCLLTLDTSSDFADVNADNTVINKGKDNFVGATALFCGIQNAKFENSTSAYVKLINGDYKYLLGTQRDIFRLKTRNVGFAVKPITEFNDLYQNISITSNCSDSVKARKFIDFLLSKKSELNRIGMLADGIKLYDDEMSVCENLAYNSKISYPINEEMKGRIDKALATGDINILKELLK